MEDMSKTIGQFIEYLRQIVDMLMQLFSALKGQKEDAPVTEAEGE